MSTQSIADEYHAAQAAFVRLSQQRGPGHPRGTRAWGDQEMHVWRALRAAKQLRDIALARWQMRLRALCRVRPTEVNRDLLRVYGLDDAPCYQPRAQEVDEWRRRRDRLLAAEGIGRFRANRNAH